MVITTYNPPSGISEAQETVGTPGLIPRYPRYPEPNPLVSMGNLGPALGPRQPAPHPARGNMPVVQPPQKLSLDERLNPKRRPDPVVFPREDNAYELARADLQERIIAAVDKIALLDKDPNSLPRAKALARMQLEGLLDQEQEIYDVFHRGQLDHWYSHGMSMAEGDPQILLGKQGNVLTPRETRLNLNRAGEQAYFDYEYPENVPYTLPDYAEALAVEYPMERGFEKIQNHMRKLHGKPPARPMSPRAVAGWALGLMALTDLAAQGVRDRRRSNAEHMNPEIKYKEE